MYPGGYGGYPGIPHPWVWWVYTSLGMSHLLSSRVYHGAPPHPAHARRYPVVPAVCRENSLGSNLRIIWENGREESLWSSRVLTIEGTAMRRVLRSS